MDEIANESLTQSVIPIAGADKGEIASFSVTFDGYSRWGPGTHKCGEIANACRARYERDGLLPESVTVIRTCLFFEQRRAHWNFGYDEEDIAYVKCLLSELREKVQADAHLRADEVATVQCDLSTIGVNVPPHSRSPLIAASHPISVEPFLIGKVPQTARHPWVTSILIAGGLIGGPGSFFTYIFITTSPRTDFEQISGYLAFFLVVPLGFFVWVYTGMFPWRYFLVGSLQILFLICAGLLALTSKQAERVGR